MGGGDEDVLDGGVETLQDGEVEQARALGVHRQVRGQLAPVSRRRRRHRSISEWAAVDLRGAAGCSYRVGSLGVWRSEERRVGKECRN